MDKLKLAFRLVAKQAKQRRENGSVPVFLGVGGMLALMYDAIRKFSESEEDVSGYVMDLAVSAMFAFSTTLPDMDFDEEQTEDETTDEMPDNHDEEETADSEGSEDDPRWTRINPGDSLPVVRKVESDDGD